MKKIGNLLILALLTIGMGLTSCDEQLDNAVTPGTDEQGEVTSITVDLSKIDEKYLDTEKTKLQLTVGDEVTLSFTILPEEMASTEVELTAGDATILSIDGLKVKALKEGETKVTAKAGDKTAECTVIVKAAGKTLAEATSEDIGKIAGKDGKIYATKADAEAVATGNAVAMIAYVGSDTYDATYKNGLAIALADEAQSNWSTAKSTCEGKTAITGAKWCLPSEDQWKQMFKANGGNERSYTGLNTTITTAGGTTLQSDLYWLSSEYDPGVRAYDMYLFNGGAYWTNDREDLVSQVRACLAF